MFPCLFLLSACGGGGGVGDFLMDNSRGSLDLAPWSVLTKVIPWARTWVIGCPSWVGALASQVTLVVKN